ncbi:MAG: alpha/beta hydrolase [Acidobacteriota bacterium]
MEIKKRSNFKDPAADTAWFEGWVDRLEGINGRSYKSIRVTTAIGETQVWSLDSDEAATETLVIFPGARTTSLIWDLDRGLDRLGASIRIFLIETNGLPNLSDGATPDIHSMDYGLWAAEVLEKLGIKEAFVAGSSFGGLICAKLAIAAPERVNAAFLLNPGCLQSFSMRPANLFYNLLPIIRPTEANVRRFLDRAIFSKPHHQLSAEAEQMLVDYEVFAIKRYRDRTQKPYFMDQELRGVRVPTYLMLGTEDLLFPFERSAENAEELLPRLMETKVFADVGHGIETHGDSLAYLGERIKAHDPVQK